MEFGKIEYNCSLLNDGKRQIRRLKLTLIGLEDKDLLLKKGVRELRLNRIMRLTREAWEQGCLLGYGDLSALLLTSLATLKRDLSYLEAQGHQILLSGRRKIRNVRLGRQGTGDNGFISLGAGISLSEEMDAVGK